MDDGLHEFCMQVIDILRKNFPQREFEYDGGAESITSGTLRFGMRNMYLEYQQSREGVDLEGALVSRFESAFNLVETNGIVSLGTWDEMKSRLRMQLVRADLASMDQIVTFPFSAEVRSAIVLDSEKGYAYVRRVDLDRWEKSAIDVQEVARQNLLEASLSISMMYVPEPIRLVVIQTGDGYDAARVLLPEIRSTLIEQLTNQDSGMVLVGIPNRDFLIAWPTDAPPDFHQRMREQLLEDSKQQHHPLAGQPFRITVESITPV